MTHPTDDPVLRRFRAALHALYGEQLARVVLFGSRARGEARADADYDIAVFLHAPPDQRRERRRLADLRVDFLDETGAFFDTHAWPVDAWRERTPLMHEIRRDGVDV